MKAKIIFEKEEEEAEEEEEEEEEEKNLISKCHDIHVVTALQLRGWCEYGSR